MAEKIILKVEELKALSDELKEIGKTQFLLKHDAITIYPDGNWAVKYFEGLKNQNQEAMPGHIYTSDFPYRFWQEVLEQVNYFDFKREQRAKAQALATKPI